MHDIVYIYIDKLCMTKLMETFRCFVHLQAVLKTTTYMYMQLLYKQCQCVVVL